MSARVSVCPFVCSTLRRFDGRVKSDAEQIENECLRVHYNLYKLVRWKYKISPISNMISEKYSVTGLITLTVVHTLSIMSYLQNHRPTLRAWVIVVYTIFGVVVIVVVTFVIVVLNAVLVFFFLVVIASRHHNHHRRHGRRIIFFGLIVRLVVPSDALLFFMLLLSFLLLLFLLLLHEYLSGDDRITASPSPDRTHNDCQICWA